MKKYKLEKGLINRLTNFTKRSIGQTQFLFELCEFDFDKLIELERKIKNHHIWYCPDDKNEVKRILNLSEGSKRFKLSWISCQPMCRIKCLDSFTGLISSKINKSQCSCCGNIKFKDQFGVKWNDIELSKYIQNKGGHPYFWNDSNSLEVVIVSEFDNDNNLLWGFDPTKKEIEK